MLSVSLYVLCCAASPQCPGKLYGGLILSGSGNGDKILLSQLHDPAISLAFKIPSSSISLFLLIYKNREES